MSFGRALLYAHNATISDDKLEYFEEETYSELYARLGSHKRAREALTEQKTRKENYEREIKHRDRVAEAKAYLENDKLRYFSAPKIEYINSDGREGDTTDQARSKENELLDCILKSYATGKLSIVNKNVNPDTIIRAVSTTLGLQLGNLVEECL